MASGHTEFRWCLLAPAARKSYRKGHLPLWVIFTRVHGNGLGFTEFDDLSSCTQTVQKGTLPIMVILAPGLTRVHDNGLGCTRSSWLPRVRWSLSSCTQTVKKGTLPIMVSSLTRMSTRNDGHGHTQFGQFHDLCRLLANRTERGHLPS